MFKKLLFLSAALLLVVVLSSKPAQSQQASPWNLEQVTKELLTLEEKWIRGYILNDPTLVDSLLADEYFTIMGGQMVTKEITLTSISKRLYQMDSGVILDPRVQLYGDVAILQGMFNAKGVRDGEAYEDVARFLDVWVKRGGRWQCVGGDTRSAESSMPITTTSHEAYRLYIKGREKLEAGDDTAAGPLLDQAVALDSSFVLAYIDISQMRSRGWSATVANLTKAKAHAGRVTMPERLYLQYFLSSLDMDQTDNDEIVKTLIAMYPGDKRINLFTGAHFQFLKKDLKAALPYYQKAIKVDKEFAPAWNNLGYYYMAVNDFDASEAAFKEYIRLNPDGANPYDSYGDLLQEMGRYDESTAQYLLSVKHDSQFVISKLKIGDNYFFKGDYTEARAQYRRVFAEARDLTDKLNALERETIVWAYSNEIGEALKTAARRRDLAVKRGTAAIAYDILNAYRDEISILLETGKQGQALKKYTESIVVLEKAGISPGEDRWWRVYGIYVNTRADAEEKRLEKARKTAASLRTEVNAMKNVNMKDYLQVALASIELQESNYDSAIARLDLASASPRIRFLQGQAALLKGERAKAEEYFRQVVEKNTMTLSQGLIWNRAQQELQKLAAPAP